MSTLLLRLSGPLQSWGTESRFNTRQTWLTPSKSGVTGLLAAAIGLRRDADLSALNKFRFGVRTDQRGSILRDYHMVHYKRKQKDAVDVTIRYYLADAVFLVGLESSDGSFLEDLVAALKAPAWPLYLGRRSCPPTLPLVLGIRELSLEEALRKEPWQVSEWRQKQWERKHADEKTRLPIMVDAKGTGYGSVVVQDEPLSFDQAKREYGFRRVEGLQPVEAIMTDHFYDKPTQHDAFAEVEV